MSRKLKKITNTFRKIPRKHLKRVEEAKRVSAEHEQYLQDMRMFHNDRSPPSVPGFSTPFEIFLRRCE